MLNVQYAMEYADAGFTFLCISPGVSRLPILTMVIYIVFVLTDDLAVAENGLWRAERRFGGRSRRC
jgi:hypothetical protein